MGVADDEREMAALLNTLKLRSGYSYEQIAGKTHFSRSSVHRYCSGHSVPVSFGAVERIATVCGADRDELARLYHLWDRATSPQATSTRPAPGNPRGVTAPVTEATRPPSPGPPIRQRAVSQRAHLPLLLVALVLVVTLTASGQPEISPSTGATSNISAPMWTRSPRPVDPEFVSVTTNSSTGHMPTFDVGSVRLWDSNTRWQKLEPEPGRFDWTVLDRLVTGASGAGLPVLFTFGGTPGWASPSGPHGPYRDDSRSSPPDDLADWSHFVATLAQRYRGRVDAYELWNLANHPQFFTGSVEVLVEMTRRASAEIRAADPAATVACPSMGQMWEPEPRRVLERFGELGGFEHCDVAAVKLHQRSASDPPETMLELARDIERSLHHAGTGLPVWNTGTDYDTPYQDPVEPHLAADYATRFFLTGLYARYDRMYFYNWGSAAIPLVLQPAGGPATEAASHVAVLRRWLDGALIRSCRKGASGGLPDELWQCEFDSPTGRFVIWWTVRGSVTVPAPSGTATLHRLDGTSSAIAKGTPIAVSGSPIALR